MTLCVRRLRHSFSRHDFRIQRIPSQGEMLPLIVDPDNTQTGHIEIRQLGIVPLPYRRFRNGNSTKETISIMKPRQIVISILAVLFVFPLIGTFAQQAPNSGSIEVITTFDYPGTGIVTTAPQKINERGDIVGEFIDSSGVVRGFVRFSDGSFSAPIVDPNDTVGFTEGRGINNSRTVVGDYAISDGNNHGFFLSGGTFTAYDIPGAATTVVLGINDAGDFTGGDDSSGTLQAFISVGGTITSFGIPGTNFTLAYDINNSKKLVVGYYIDSSGILHGYYRDANGALHFPIDPSGSVSTVLFGDNDRNWVVGRYADSSGVTHGLFFTAPNNFFTFDYPGSTFTSLNGINAQGFICGRYGDASGIGHGIIARVRGTPPTTPAATEMKANASPSLVTPLDQSPSAWGGAKPAR